MAWAIVAGAAISVVGGALMAPDAPDNSGMNRAAEGNAKVAADTLSWYKEKDAANKPMQDKLANKAYEVADQQLASSKANDALAADYANYNKTTFRPLEQGIVAEAAAYDTPQKRQAAADSAMADTNMAFSRTNEANARTMAANGINPGSTRAMAVQDGRGVDQAVANAGAAFKARQGVETIGAARKMDAASLGRGLASSQATSAQLALTAGNNAVANTGAPITAANASTSVNGQGFGTAIQGNNSAGNLYGQAAQIQNTANSSSDALYGAFGQMGGAAISKYSDETLKTDITDMSDEEALAATNDTPVKKWKYDPAKMAARGIPMEHEDLGEQIGPMAQDVNATMGEQAAPEGKKLNMVTMNGVNMKSIQAVDKKVVALTKQVGSLASMIRGGAVQAGARA